MTTVALKLMIIVCYLFLLVGRATEINGHFSEKNSCSCVIWKGTGVTTKRLDNKSEKVGKHCTIAMFAELFEPEWLYSKTPQQLPL